MPIVCYKYDMFFCEFGVKHTKNFQKKNISGYTLFGKRSYYFFSMDTLVDYIIIKHYFQKLKLKLKQNFIVVKLLEDLFLQRYKIKVAILEERIMNKPHIQFANSVNI